MMLSVDIGVPGDVLVYHSPSAITKITLAKCGRETEGKPRENRGKRENTGILVSTSVKMYLLCKNKSPPMLGVLRVSMPLHISLVFYILAWVASRLCRKVCLDRKKVEKQQSDKACRSLKVDNILYIHTYYTCMCLLYSFRPKVFIRLHGN